MALLLHFDDFLLGLGHLRIFLLFVVHVGNLGLTDQIVTVERSVTGCDLSINVMVEDEDLLFVQVEFGLLNLTLGWHRGV